MKFAKYIFTAFFAVSAVVASAGTLEDVKERGSLVCGVSTGLAGFSAVNADGRMEGLDADTCRAVAAAVLGNSDAVEWRTLTAKERFTALASGEIDVLVRNTTWTTTRDTDLGITFAGINYYDGQGFLVKTDVGAKSDADLDGAAFCIQAGTTTELNLADHFAANGWDFEAITYDSSNQTRDGFEQGRCDVLTSDVSQLAALRSQLADPSSAEILGTVISKEPLGPVVRQGDDAWFKVVRWVMNALIQAEELGVHSDNVGKLSVTSNDPRVKKFLGKEGGLGEKLGLDSDWAANIVRQVGNYGELFEKNVGKNTPLALPRGVNALWNKGGLMYPNPMR